MSTSYLQLEIFMGWHEFTEYLETALSNSKVLLVPYSTWHVPRYHEWMQDEEIQQATASEPLTIEEEYAMQRSWRQDADKLTFIVCRPVVSPSNEDSGTSLRPEDDSSDNMIGDINLFLRVEDGEDGHQTPEIIGEIELMIAEKINQRKGFGKAALLAFLRYIVEEQAQILNEFVRGDVDAQMVDRLEAVAKTSAFEFSCLSVKIGHGNLRSLALFESLGFQKVTPEPNFFGEFELRRKDLTLPSVNEALEGAGVLGYTRLSYQRKD